MTRHHVALAAAVFGGICGQLLLKTGAVGATDVWGQLMRPASILGLACYGLSAIGYMFALQVIPVSIAFPSVATSYVIIAVLGAVMWSEPIGLPQAAGIGLICAGVVLLYRG